MFSKFVILASMALPLCGQAVPPQALTHAQAAVRAEQRGDFATAVHEYESVVRMLPINAEMKSNLGVALYFDHDLSRAIKVFGQAISRNPQLFAPHLFSGLARYRLSDPDAAVPELEKAVRLKPSDVIAHTWLGYAYNAQGSYEPALKELRKAQQLDPDNLDVWFALGQNYLEIGRQATQQLLTVAPDGARAWQLSGEQLKLKGDTKGAVENFMAALNRRPQLSEVRIQVTELGGNAPPAPDPASQRSPDYSKEDALYRQAHDAEDQARVAFERIAQIAPDSYRTHQIMADALFAQEQYAKSLEEYRMVVKLKPDLPGIHEAIGNILLRTNKPQEALAEFQSELIIQPRSAGAFTNVGQAMIILGNDKGAGEIFAKAIQLDRPPPELYRLMGKVDLHLNNYFAAAKELNQYATLKPRDATAYYLLSKAYRGLGDKAQMQQALARFQETSRDAKARSHAQMELEALNNRKQPIEDTEAADNPRR
ncbi:MAG: tetratricopeptide repeat protein [Terriglobales bacterium]